MLRKIRIKRGGNRFAMLIISLVVVCLNVTMIYGVSNVKAKLNEKTQEEIKLKESLAREEKREAEIEKQKEYKDTDEYIEEIARRFGYVYKDEILFTPDENKK